MFQRRHRALEQAHELSRLKSAVAVDVKAVEDRLEVGLLRLGAFGEGEGMGERRWGRGGEV